MHVYFANITKNLPTSHSFSLYLYQKGSLVKKIFICFLFLLLPLLRSLAQDKPKTGWVFTPMPNVGYTTDIGVTLGAYSDFFYYGDGSTYPNFLHHAGFSAAYATKGSWYAHFYFESPALIADHRVNASVTYRDAMVNNFYGFNGIASPYDAALDLNAERRTAWYTNHRRFFRVSGSVMGNIGPHLDWMGGFVFRHVRMEDFSLEKYDSGHSLFTAYRDIGLIREDEFAGGTSLEFKGGVVYDSRDVELSPGRGMYGELYLVGNAALGHWKYSYAQLVAHFRHYVTLVPERLVFAWHLGLQHQFAGEIPYYNLNEVATIFYPYEEICGLGSRVTVRGIRYNRVMAAGYAWGNFEFRFIPFRFRLFNQDVNLVLNPFADLCAITRPYRLEEQKKLSGIYPELNLWQDRSLPVMAAFGLGGKIQINTNFILSLDVGRGLDPQVSDWTIGMATTYVF